MTSNILLVDDTPQNLQLLFNILLNQGYKVRCAINGALALKAIESLPPDLILLDINMPDMDGYSVCRQLKSCQNTQEIPVIFVSAMGETLDKVKAFESGGVDYVTKPFQLGEVLARISTHLSLKQAQAEIKVLNEQLEQRVVERTLQLQEEMAERQRVQEKLIYQTTHDRLTDCLNLPGFVKVLEQSMDQTQFLSETYAVLSLTCERFQRITNAFGHLVGDHLLLQVAHRLNHGFSDQAVIARIGSDRFVVLLKGLAANREIAQQTCLAMAKQVQGELSKVFIVEHHQIFLQTKWGITLGQPQYSRADHILRDASIACSQAYSQGLTLPGRTEGNIAAYCVFNAHMHDQALEKVQLESNLRQAIDRQEFIVHYQPIVSLSTGEIRGMEALVRWQHPEQGFISPSQFIPAAESSGLIVPLGAIVMRQACEQFRQWQQQHPSLDQLKVSVNLSVRQFAQPDLVERIQQMLADTDLQPENLQLEITESAIMESSESAASILERLRSQNIQLAIDDFGTGYSSLSYLTQFPVDTLKIDRAFVNQLGQDPKHVGIFQAIVTLANTLGMDIVAEGIETDRQLQQLRTFGCQLGQGYLFSKPVDSTTMAKLFTQPVWSHHWLTDNIKNDKGRVATLH
ncbi:EAL domain-containing protein [Leptolyngbyaceae cyanobacterium CCMR0082]|uniref:EAL domain-containing protein n=2 Tax=Adonisia TaxID=2950183 RepID=A0A6M0SEV2_9CYAN|nr:EAL domain-containing protein [Adonisia turfae]NEZ67019.1 EAL domain-containing protein [Adonisia turfae CCMR0082]